MNIKQLKAFWLEEEIKGFSGWDFSHIKDRMAESPLPWNYDAVVRSVLKQEHKLLDMGTGGGEYLLTLNHPYHNTCVTEAYPPNFELCQKKLVPLGINVCQVFNDHTIPYENETFDRIINRHESFEASEVHRMLKPGGLLITQQVGGLNNKALSRFLIPEFQEIVSSDYNLENTLKQLESKGFTIEKSEECLSDVKIFDIGALVYFAKIIEWEFPDFSVERCFDKLCELQRQIASKGFIESTGHRFIIVAKK